MTIERFRDLYEAQPFRPFVIRLADGRSITVNRREFIALGPTGRTVLVYQPDESFDVLDLLLVTDLEVAGAASLTFGLRNPCGPRLAPPEQSAAAAGGVHTGFADRRSMTPGHA